MMDKMMDKTLLPCQKPHKIRRLQFPPPPNSSPRQCYCCLGLCSFCSASGRQLTNASPVGCRRTSEPPRASTGKVAGVRKTDCVGNFRDRSFGMRKRIMSKLFSVLVHQLHENCSLAFKTPLQRARRHVEPCCNCLNSCALAGF